MSFGPHTMKGTFTEVSNMFMGHVPLPLPQMPCWPRFMPLSPEKTTMVFSSRPLRLSASITRPTPSSTAVMAL